MTDKLLVSIIIDSYNYGSFLRRAIDSALSQTYQSVEVIVVDDGSTDDSPEIITSYGNRIVAVLKNNGGQSSAMNAGFEMCQGEIIALLDSDDWFEPNKVEEVVEVFIKNPDVSWCFHPLKLIKQGEDTPFMTTRIFPHLDQDVSQKCDFRKRLKRGYLNFYAPSTSGLCFDRSSLEKIFPLPEVLGNAVDRYLAYAAMSMGKGYFLNNELTGQITHGKNHVTLQKSELAYSRMARHTIVSAYYIQSDFPELRWFSHRLFSRGLAMSWQHDLAFTDGLIFIEKYLSMVSFIEKMLIRVMALYRLRPWKSRKLYRASIKQQLVSPH